MSMIKTVVSSLLLLLHFCIPVVDINTWIVHGNLRVHYSLQSSMAASSLFNSGYHVGTMLVSSGLLPEAWKACCSAYSSNHAFSFWDYAEESRICIAFPSNLSFYTAGGSFGECQVGPGDTPFGFLKDRALVHRGVWIQFMKVLQDQLFRVQIAAAQKEKKTVVLTGHSFGGAMAVLATLWLLDLMDNKVPIFCITFGCPLIGDSTLSKSIYRKGWNAKFCHIVSSHDIIPRVLLAPINLTQGPLQSLHLYWSRQMSVNRLDSSIPIDNPVLMQHFKSLYSIVTHTLEAINYSDAISKTHFSPYRPFGNYMFCTKEGTFFVENVEEVMTMLYHTLAVSISENVLIEEHTNYGTCLRSILRKKLANTKLALQDAFSPFDVGIFLQLSTLGLEIKDFEILKTFQVAREKKEQFITECKQLEVKLSQAQKAMSELEWYKRECEKDGIGYYDSFKQQANKQDHRANLNRIRLNGFWDEIIEILKAHDLLDLCKNKWIYSATAYRLLVEPLDIADFYRRGLHQNGHYISAGRPDRFKILEKLWEVKIARDKQDIKPRIKPASLTQDSCFWAYFEEVCYFLERGSMEAMPKLKEFALRVRHLDDAKELSKEVFLDNCSFGKWWKMLPDSYK